MTRHATTLLILSWLGVGAGCAASTEDTSEADSTVGETDEHFDSAADGAARPLGTFRGGGWGAHFNDLLVKDDSTYIAIKQVECVRGPCDPIVTTGSVRFTTRSSHKYLRLVDADGSDFARYEYWLRDLGDTLILRLIGDTNRVTYTRDAEMPYCQAATDCQHQGLRTPRCIGRWNCADNACAYECGIAPVAPVAPHCDAVGSRSEGWYKADGTLSCWASCAGHTAHCGAAGTRSEGWYTDDGFGCGGGGGLIGWTDCDPAH